MYRFFLTPPPKKKQKNTAAVSVNPVTEKGSNWLLGGFLFGTEIGWAN